MKMRIMRSFIATGIITLIIFLSSLPFLIRLYHYKSIRKALEHNDSDTALDRIEHLPDSYNLDWTLWDDISWIPKVVWIYEHTVGCPSCAADGYPLLWHAARNGESEVVDTLLNNGASIHYASDNGAEIIRAATMSGNTNTVLLLLAKGADIKDTNYCQVAAIHMATINSSYLQMLQLLISAGADVNSIDWQGRTPLDYAYTWNTNAIPILLTHGAQLGKSDWLRQVNKEPNNRLQAIDAKASQPDP